MSDDTQRREAARSYPRIFCYKLPVAHGGEPIEFTFDEPVPTFEDAPPGEMINQARAFYNKEAARFLDHLQKHAPGGFVDALFGELAHRKASIFRVANPFITRLPDSHIPDFEKP